MEITGCDSVVFTFTSHQEVLARILAVVVTRWPNALLNDLDAEECDPQPVASFQVERLPMEGGQLLFYRDAAMARHMDEFGYELMEDGEGPFAVLTRDRRDVVFNIDKLNEAWAADHTPGEGQPPAPYQAWLCSPQVVEVTIVTPASDSDPFSCWVLAEVQRACRGIAVPASDQFGP